MLASSGKVVGLLALASSVLVVDVALRQTSLLGDFGPEPDGTKWNHAVALPDDRVIRIPYAESRVLLIDVEKHTIELFGDAGSMDCKFGQGILLPSGKVVATPCNSTGMLLIDPEARSITPIAHWRWRGRWVLIWGSVGKADA